MPNDLRTQNAPYQKFDSLEPGAVFRFIGQDDLHETWIKAEIETAEGGAAVSLKNGTVSAARHDASVYRIKQVKIVSPGED